MKNIAILASGSGSNAENIYTYFSSSTRARVSLIVTDNPEAGVIPRAERLGIPLAVVPRADFAADGRQALQALGDHDIDYVVLAGFLRLVPPALIDAYRGRIINIHPALLPAYGGRGMYGDNVHRAVVAARELVSGITIHHVDKRYDSGSVIAQFTTPVTETDTPETLAERIHNLEYAHFPQIIEREISKL